MRYNALDWPPIDLAFFGAMLNPNCRFASRENEGRERGLWGGWVGGEPGVEGSQRNEEASKSSSVADAYLNGSI